MIGNAEKFMYNFLMSVEFPAQNLLLRNNFIFMSG